MLKKKKKPFCGERGSEEKEGYNNTWKLSLGFLYLLGFAISPGPSFRLGYLQLSE